MKLTSTFTYIVLMISTFLFSDTEAPLELKRTVGLFSGISLIVGTMIGSGIFVSPTGLLDRCMSKTLKTSHIKFFFAFSKDISAESQCFRTGSVAMSLIVWVACGFVSMLGALAYAELGTMIPRLVTLPFSPLPL